jgi:hypothetical protein
MIPGLSVGVMQTIMQATGSSLKPWQMIGLVILDHVPLPSPSPAFLLRQTGFYLNNLGRLVQVDPRNQQTNFKEKVKEAYTEGLHSSWFITNLPYVGVFSALLSPMDKENVGILKIGIRRVREIARNRRLERDYARSMNLSDTRRAQISAIQEHTRMY